MIQETGIWRRGFQTYGDASPDTRRLMASLESFRNKVAQVTSKIAGDLPQLTIHDITHLDALWEIADVIVGDDFPVNPLETFVFGGAVLLHDVGLCFAAYEGGKQGLRSTIQWKDAHARLSSLNKDSPSLRQDADFEALRYLHASQAAKLASEPWQLPSTDPMYLIDDKELRDTYGDLIGQIASSHHWDIEVVVQRLSTLRPPPSFLQKDWAIDPLKLACMLRVTDAGHIDGARAPTFLLNLLEINSVSRSHWIAQNRLGRVMINPKDPTQLIVASTRPFTQDKAAAWWVAFDAIALFDKELRECNEVLENTQHGQPLRFPRQRVLGAGNVRELTKHVQTTGWEPTDTKVHVSDVASLIERLGGAELYGTQDKLEVVIRELVQNSADAIMARRALVTEDFEGRILVRLVENSKRGSFTLQIDDDGIGMSSRTLSDDLMDFGKSFWENPRASQEFPGIHAADYTPVGHFGIGFFSVFMIADSAKVFSRRFDKGLGSLRCLTFANGLSLRPTLSGEKPPDIGMGTSTRVDIELKRTTIADPNHLEIHGNLQGHKNFSVTFRDYVTAIVSGINVRVDVEWDDSITRVHGGFPPKEDARREWLEALSYVNTGVNENARGLLVKNVHRLREIRGGEKCHGLAAINISQLPGADFLSAKAVGGLVSPHNRYNEPFLGLIDHFPKSAKREAGERVGPEESIRAWLIEQEDILNTEGLDPVNSIIASASFCAFNYDPIRILRGILVATETGYEIWQVDRIAWFLDRGRRLGFRVSSLGSFLDSFGQQRTLPNISTYHVLGRGEFNNVELEGGVPKNGNSVIGVIHRSLKEKGRSPTWSTTPNAYEDPFGKCDLLELVLS